MTTVKATVAGEKRFPWVFGLPVAAVASDAFLEQAGKHHPAVHFIGMFPGLIRTEVMLTAFPEWLARLLSVFMIPVALSEEECGDIHANVLSSPNAEQKQVSYFNHLLEGRHTMPMAYNHTFSEWMWEFLVKTRAEHR